MPLRPITPLPPITDSVIIDGYIPSPVRYGITNLPARHCRDRDFDVLNSNGSELELFLQDWTHLARCPKYACVVISSRYGHR